MTPADVVDFAWTVKNRPKGLAEFTMPQLTNGQPWDGKDVTVEEDGLDDDILNEILNETKKPDL